MIEGRVWRYGDDVNTDVIFPGKYTYQPLTPEEMATHALEDLDASFAKEVKQGDVIVAGANFGCGSSREHAPISIKGAGVSCVIAASYARIFYRNAINIGLPILESAEAARDIEAGEEIEVRIEDGLIRNLSTGKEYRTAAYPRFMLAVINAGGLVGYTVRRIEERRKTG